MAYIGNTNETQAFAPAIDYFNGNGSSVAFTLSRPVASVAQVQAVIENVPQNPGTAFTVFGNTITFDSPPPSGTNNIYVSYTSPITQVIQPSQGTVGTAQLAPLTTLPVVGGATLTLPATSGTVLTTGSSITATSITNSGGWSVTPSGTKLYFNYNGTNVASLDSSGNFIALAGITAYGTV